MKKAIGNWVRVGGAVGCFFGLKLLVGLTLLSVSARYLSVADFSLFSQLFFFLALITALSAGGVQQGLIREIATASENAAAIRLAVMAALSIWAVTALTLIIVATLLRNPISVLLVGSNRAGEILPWIALLALTSGCGQIFFAILTGQGRAPESLMLQSLGLLAGGILALLLLMGGKPEAAVAAFAAGPLLPTIIGALRIRSYIGPVHLQYILGEMGRLIGYSLAFFCTAAIMPLTLLAVRAVYRNTFGIEALGYWLAANRISDVTSQLLGLFMGQAFLPVMSRKFYPEEKLKTIQNMFLLGTLLIGAGLISFIVADRFWVTLFLSVKFVPAIPFIIGYLAGDTLRVSVSIVLYTALANRQLSFYIAVEAVTAGIFASLVLVLIWFRVSQAPTLAYCIVQLIMAVAAWIWLLPSLYKHRTSPPV